MTKKLNIRIADTPEDTGQKALNVNLIGESNSSDIFVVTISNLRKEEDDVFLLGTADKTNKEIHDAVNEGKKVFCLVPAHPYLDGSGISGMHSVDLDRAISLPGGAPMVLFSGIMGMGLLFVTAGSDYATSDNRTYRIEYKRFLDSVFTSVNS